jgi:hypothetical protein
VVNDHHNDHSDAQHVDETILGWLSGGPTVGAGWEAGDWWDIAEGC